MVTNDGFEYKQVTTSFLLKKYLLIKITMYTL